MSSVTHVAGKRDGDGGGGAAAAVAAGVVSQLLLLEEPIFARKFLFVVHHMLGINVYHS